MNSGLVNESGKPLTAKICWDYVNDSWIRFLAALAIPWVVVTINCVSWNYLIQAIQWIGYKTWSSEAKAVKNGIFVTLFFNTALIVLIINCDLSDFGINSLYLIKGWFWDFTLEWYKDIGFSFVYSILFTAFWPFIEFGTFYSIRVT